jgi:fibronectin-binding autotransporter adhesin
VQFGVDQALADDIAGGQLVGELTARYGEISADVASPSGGGDIDAKGYGLGFNLTWTNAAGAYVDAQAQGSWFDSDLSSDVLGRRADGANGDGQALSLEAGRAVAVGQAWRLTPQAQLSYSHVDFDSFIDPLGAAVSNDRSDSFVARLGLAVDHDWSSGGGIYGVINLRHEFLDGARVDVSGAPLASRAERTWGGLAAGGTYAWGGGRYAVYGEASADTALSGFGDSYDISGTAGFRIRF